MDFREACMHTRSYGCRIRRYTLDGVEMLSMENSLLKVVFATGKGTDIVEFVYKPMDVDYMWHSFNRLRNKNHVMSSNVPSGNFLDVYSGGWQELCPTYGSDTIYHGGEIGVHGEACIYPWDCEIVCDRPERIEVRFTLRLIRSPFILEKTAVLAEGEAKLQLHQKITNLSAVEQEFMWGHHPAFGYPFLDDSVRIRVTGDPDVVVPASNIMHHCPFAVETAGKWPLLPDKNGKPIDLSRAYAAEDRIYMEYAISNFAQGQYELVNENKGLGFRMHFDKTLFPYLWVWGLYCGIDEYPWFGRTYVLAVEPWSSMPGDFAAAKEAGRVLKLASGASMETSVCAEAFTEQKH